MQDKIEKILIGAIFEETEKNIDFSIESTLTALNLLLDNSKTLFEKVPMNIYVPMERYKEVEKSCGSEIAMIKGFSNNFGKNHENDITFFEKKGLLIYDGIYGAAFGRMNYIYKSKGTRVYLFEDREIVVFGTYCSIDHDGFSFSNEEIDKYHLDNIAHSGNVEMLFQYFNQSENEKPNISKDVLKILTKIIEVFHKDYVIEYLLLPPDVDKLSDFSKQIKTKLWDICLSERFTEEWPEELQHNAMTLLTGLEFNPTAKQLLNFLDLKKTSGINSEIMKKLDLIQSSIIENQKDDLIDIKPNFFGMGINGNEAYKRMRNKFKKN